MKSTVIAAALLTMGAVFAVPAAKADPLPYGPDTCAPGYVWRDAAPNDHVCVTPAERSQAAAENAAGPSHLSPTGGPYGPNTCLSGYVWRDAFGGEVALRHHRQAVALAAGLPAAHRQQRGGKDGRGEHRHDQQQLEAAGAQRGSGLVHRSVVFSLPRRGRWRIARIATAATAKLNHWNA